MVKKLTILMVPLPGVGPVNAFIGLAEVLVSRGHKVVFAVDKTLEGKLSPLGFVEELFTSTMVDVKKKTGEESANILLTSGLLSGISSLDKFKIFFGPNFTGWADNMAKMRANEPQLRAIIAKHNPDIYMTDGIMCSPTLIHSGKPWVYVFSPNPLYVINDDRTPPAFSGYPSTDSKEGFPLVANNRAIPDSPYLNIYGYPEELDYTDICPMREKWFRIDAFMRKSEQEFKIPDKFRERDNN
ncbi:unnamed protein product, partial [Medioppia subpectinata]